MSEQIQPERPPTSGPGSGVGAWRDYAAALSGTSVESWAELSREDIIARLDAEGVELTGPEAEADADVDSPEPETADAAPARPRRRPEWMVPTDEGPVPERLFRRRGR